MKQKKDQFIALCAESLEEARRLLPVAQELGKAFGKGVILFSCREGAEEWVEQVECPHVVLKGEWPAAVETMPVAFNVVMAVVGCDTKAPRGRLAHPKGLLKAFRESKVAYMAVGGLRDEVRGRSVGLTLDYRRESKEKVVWASYMARFCGSKITVYHLPYSDGGFRKGLENNVRYMDKVFKGLNIGYELRELTGCGQYADADLKALERGESEVMIVQVADERDRDLLDRLLPPPPLRLLQKAGGRPLLFLNQRDDLYVMCD